MFRVLCRQGVMDARGECEGYQGYWVDDEQNFEEGFVEEFENTFWTYDDSKDCCMIRRNFRFKMRRPAKGKRKREKKKRKRKRLKRSQPFSSL